MLVCAIAIGIYVYIPHKQLPSYSEEILDSSLNKPQKEIRPNTICQKQINPNTATFEELCSIGFTKKQAYNCLNYLKAGNTFKTKDDLKKLYTISLQDFEKISRFIFIPQSTISNNTSTLYSKTPKTQKNFKIELNTCDTIALQKIPGIGSFRAKKIIEFRNKLGGFYSISQLHTIYSFDSTLVASISPYCTIDTAHIHKININTATFKEMQAHPYISYNQTKNIIEYKKIVGTIGTIDELQRNNIIKSTDYEILKYYIKTF